MFLGGWNGPGVAAVSTAGRRLLFREDSLLLFLYIWRRGTLPRFRFDQLMNFGW